MKKSLLLVSLILVAIAILPIIGNSVIKKVIDEKIVELKKIGIEVKIDNADSAYFNTSRHFEFLLKDGKKILKYLDVSSNKQVDLYSNILLDDILVGMDIKYNNFPFSKAIEIEIYPLKISKNLEESLKKKDIRVYKYLVTSLKLKRILCHVNYNLINDKFDGYLNNIDENLNLKSGTIAKFKITKMLFDGTMKVDETEIFNLSVKELSLNLNKTDESMSMIFDKFKSSSKFDVKNGYKSSFKLDNMLIITKGTSNDIEISLDKLKASSNLDTKALNVKIDSKSFVKNLKFSSKHAKFQVKNLKFNTKMDGLDKKEFEHLRVLAMKSDANNMITSIKLQNKIKKSLTSLVSKGLVVSIDDYSFENIKVNSKDLKDASIKVKMNIKKDEDFKNKLKLSPLLVLENFDIKIGIKLSKEIYEKIREIQPNMVSFKRYAKVKNNNVIFDIVFKNSKFYVNGEAVN